MASTRRSLVRTATTPMEMRVVRVGLSVVPGVEQPHPVGGLRRDVEHPLTGLKRPLRQRPSNAVRVLDRSGPFRPGLGVLDHRGLARVVGGGPAAA